MLRKHEAELSNTTAQAGCLLDQVGLESGIRKIQSGPHAADTASYHKGRGRLSLDYLTIHRKLPFRFTKLSN